MDTKWKNIKYNKATKIVALLLAALMFFLAGNYAGLFIKGFANFNIFAHPEDFTNTASFRNQMNRYINDVVRKGKFINIGSFEEWLDSADAKAYSENYDLQKKETEEFAKFLDSSGIRVYVDGQNRYRYTLDYKGVRYFMQYNGEFISYTQFQDYEFVNIPEVEEPATAFETTVYGDNTEITYPETPAEHNIVFYDPYEEGGVPEHVNRVSEALLRLNSIGEYTCYGETSLEEMLAVIEENRIETLRDQYSWESSYGAHSNEVDAVKNVNFAVIFKDGSVYTNCGVYAKDNHGQIVSKLGGDNLLWAECVINGKYELLIGEKNRTPSGVYATLHEWLFSNYARESALGWNTWINTDEVTSAYFAIDEPMRADPFFATSYSFDNYNKDASLTRLLFVTFISIAVACALCIYLLSVTGKSADGSAKIRFLDKVPIEINTVLVVALMFAVAVAVVGIVVYEYDPLMAADLGGLRDFVTSFICSAVPYSSALIGVLAALFFMLWTGITASLIRNIRNKTFHKHSLVCLIFKPVGWIFRKLWNWVKRIIDKIKYAFNCDYSKGQSTKFKVIACLAVSLFVVITGIYYFIVGGIMCSGDDFIAFMLYVIGALGDIAIAVFVIMLIVSLDRIMVAVSDIRKGEMGKGIDTKYMPPFMKRFAEDVLCMQDGLQNAVDSAVKDQRMKAELITNVSHDLKTPLTSIVNYVDLLKKCEIQDETALKYVSVLDEKAHKMKKLIEDLVEASKASSGAMEIHTVKLNLCELAAQAVGEHEDELKKYGIELVLKIPDEPVMVMADAQKISRVIENLFSNIRKYALEGTRVYIDVAAGAEYGSVIFKNVSKNPLDISPEELTRRFVRGDASRSGEGSGLGLSIAKDLCELQNGKLGLQIDGDLFKAVVALPIA
ncbi:MAG: HAMP domain-containing sensor histidine kinase [Acutalibacteraceae bacterium]|nr:HAMP domain-containing sensor histidine kinase [Acutalibacteraceae bacterium]